MVRYLNLVVSWGCGPLVQCHEAGRGGVQSEIPAESAEHRVSARVNTDGERPDELTDRTQEQVDATHTSQPEPQYCSASVETGVPRPRGV
jgi:hypothetical protein